MTGLVPAAPGRLRPAPAGSGWLRSLPAAGHVAAGSGRLRPAAATAIALAAGCGRLRPAAANGGHTP